MVQVVEIRSEIAQIVEIRRYRRSRSASKKLEDRKFEKYMW